ncbi:uncharacterized protein MONOS_14799 [Monocercomonoides exilis]|uniref:uncharacterized protein n=1 Tax=Monocercomonoides exilis TaxID=2049356 RepID=UPI003559A209|nr:hypothetical protein MONOS_14799 [Monocercomonoides exilis]|eukprot:MONOS_14799.1-p1 / transcript=MONOS_14799.1 / gene=MONOS_14799 / organism=Monocercomonoides_exilis_PA203 / gene_product=unspecified product / transcript_product=unspecified product / location=Mono_scaffold01076:3762-4886(+) / protein_length=329 / sequence_SO=supercontig / SO=protein_coding / is_pseudo=false
MGNECPYPHYSHIYEPPLSICWTEYMRQCSFDHDKMIENDFEQNFKNKTVEWEGIVTELKDNYAKFIMNPTEVTISNSELTLFFDPPVNKAVPPLFVLHQQTKFRGKLISLGFFKNHVLDYVPMDSLHPVDAPISYEQFLSRFGSTQQTGTAKYFFQNWKGKSVVLEGFISLFKPRKETSGYIAEARFDLNSRFSDVKQEPILLLVTAERPRLVPFLQTANFVVPYTITAVFHEREFGKHVMILLDARPTTLSAEVQANIYPPQTSQSVNTPVYSESSLSDSSLPSPSEIPPPVQVSSATPLTILPPPSITNPFASQPSFEDVSSKST